MRTHSKAPLGPSRENDDDGGSGSSNDNSNDNMHRGELEQLLLRYRLDLKHSDNDLHV